MTVTLSLDALIVGGAFAGLVWAVFEFVKGQIRINNKVMNARESIIANALWEFDAKFKGIEHEVEEREPTFREELDKKSKENYFKNREEN